ncbi:MAG: hypothetical protein C5B48_08505 [Candidatus Rokuibacteriota bacterium]|nr:MAG: hypothetical protein C5B48_08505 [Candidatus Rokubacteria bacterium]
MATRDERRELREMTSGIARAERPAMTTSMDRDRGGVALSLSFRPLELSFPAEMLCFRRF